MERRSTALLLNQPGSMLAHSEHSPTPHAARAGPTSVLKCNLQARVTHRTQKLSMNTYADSVRSSTWSKQCTHQRVMSTLLVAEGTKESVTTPLLVSAWLSPSPSPIARLSCISGIRNRPPKRICSFGDVTGRGRHWLPANRGQHGGRHFQTPDDSRRRRAVDRPSRDRAVPVRIAITRPSRCRVKEWHALSELHASS